MVGTLKLKEENKKIKENAETRMAVYIYIYIVYCHLENKKVLICSRIKLNSKNKDRTILKLDRRWYRSIFLCFLTIILLY